MRIAALARDVVAQGLSVREVERRVRELAGPSTKGAAAKQVSTPDRRSAEVRRLEDHLRKRFGTDVRILQSGKERGELRIPFYSADDFERLLELLGETGSRE
jgi:ParB family chromosome partitioning protein